MEIYFNELSAFPKAESIDASRNKVLELLSVMKNLREYDINILRTHDGFYAEDLGCNYTFLSFLEDETVRRDLKILLQSIIKNPIIPDIDSYEAEMFIKKLFKQIENIPK